VTCHDVDRQIDSFVDGELAPSEAAALRTHTGACLRCRQRLAERQELARCVRQAPYYQAPASLRVSVPGQRRRPLVPQAWLAWAAVILLATSIGVGFIARSIGGRRTFDARPAGDAGATGNVEAVSAAMVDDVVAGHLRALMGDHLVDVLSTDQHTVKPWFLGKLNFAPPVDDLAAEGFPLVGGRLDYLAQQPVAALVYQRRQHTINLFVWPTAESPASAIALRSSRGFQVQHWTRDGMVFWAVSDLNHAELTAFAQASIDAQRRQPPVP
jgi:anti-sigma factor RsiW